MSKETAEDKFGPGWAAFMTQNTDRPLCEAITGAMALVRRRKGLDANSRVSWTELAEVLADDDARAEFCRAHGRELMERVMANARALGAGLT